MIELEKLIALETREVLESPSLRDATIHYCKVLFFGDVLIRTCNSSIINYHRRLQLTGLETLKKKQMAKYILNKDVVLRFDNQIYNSATITDEIAEKIIADFPDLKRHFTIKEGQKEAPVEITDESPAKAKRTRTVKK